LSSGNELQANFGLGDATNADTMRIEWPSGLAVFTDILLQTLEMLSGTTNITLIWPFSPSGFTLEATPLLTKNVWLPVTNSMLTLGGTNYVVL